MRVHYSRINTDPVKYYASLIGMGKYESRLKKQPNALSIMTGIILYRELPKNKQSEVLRQILSLNDGQLKASLYGLVSQVVANPYWFSWSLSDKELRCFFDTNRNINDALQIVGLDVNVPMTVVGVAAFLFSAANEGLKKASQNVATQMKKEITRSPVAEITNKLGLTKQAASTASAILVVMVSVIAYQTNSNAKDAQKELHRRGLLQMEDL
ncbi:hypothetical protein EXA21_15760 [Vibrio cincinnatiensis]|uniref:hypothetical protein n=1 Tax=Vibrio cincinnatiensis TaxID=675 RepID=UPI001EDF53FF|nr:hypothetical protein [Vibrio cincinnatiensis]MCG3760905.1 hypothetical protein [Vibrio cincinnatiensis]MCG3764233.1 hypothetical protein [Vibrio cincinnatiensis]